jgi:hypothetical protein
MNHTTDSAIANFLSKNPNFTVEYHDEATKTTPAIHAASQHKWSIVYALLQESKANKMAKDTRGQSLFSKAVHSDQLDWIIPFYTYQEINALCKTMPLCRNVNFTLLQSVEESTKSALQGKLPLETLVSYKTVLHECIDKEHVPYIVQLLKQGASLYTMSKWTGTPYSQLIKKPAIIFVLREAFNNGPQQNSHKINLLITLFKHYAPPSTTALATATSSLTNRLPKKQFIPLLSSIARKRKNYASYFQACFPNDIIDHIKIKFCMLCSPTIIRDQYIEKELWKNIYEQASTTTITKKEIVTLGIDDLMALSQEEKTQINTQLFIQNIQPKYSITYK